MKHAEEKSFQESHYAGEASQILCSPLMQRRRRRIIDVLIAACENSRHSRVLSLGCGNGETESLASPHFAHITGLDLSETAIAQARSRVATAATGIGNMSFLVGDCTELGSLDFKVPFDAVWALGFLHHINDDEMRRLIEGVHRVLAPGGVMVTLDPNSRRLVGLLKPLASRQVKKHHSPDERELDPRWLKTLFVDGGFDEVTVKFEDFFIGPFSWVFPGHSPTTANLLWALDRGLCSLPVLRNFSSGFQIVARRS